MDDCEQTARQLKENAELLDSLCKEKLTQLHHDKQRARKAYQEEHSRLAAQFHNVNTFFFFLICEHVKTKNLNYVLFFGFCSSTKMYYARNQSIKRIWIIIRHYDHVSRITTLNVSGK